MHFVLLMEIQEYSHVLVINVKELKDVSSPVYLVGNNFFEKLLDVLESQCSLLIKNLSYVTDISAAFDLSICLSWVLNLNLCVMADERRCHDDLIKDFLQIFLRVLVLPVQILIVLDEVYVFTELILD